MIGYFFKATLRINVLQEKKSDTDSVRYKKGVLGQKPYHVSYMTWQINREFKIVCWEQWKLTRWNSLLTPWKLISNSAQINKQLIFCTSVLLMMTYLGVSVTILVKPVLDISICKINWK